METIFKKGDKVYDHQYGWGKIVNTEDSVIKHYPIRVDFENGNSTYTCKGKYDVHMSSPSLSFTEYTLEGFSQERPEELPKKGDIVWASNHKSDWYITYFLEKDSIGGYKTTSHNPFDKNPSYSHWNYITTENPYKNENTPI